MTDFLKDYHIINNLPYGFDFYNQGLRQLRAHSKWFFENKDQRLIELQNAYHAFCGKYLDYTPESLKGLGEFFMQAIDMEKDPSEVGVPESAKRPLEIPIYDYKYASRSHSLIVDVGIYLGEVMIRNHKNMCWEQYISSNKNHVDRGYMVIIINPNRFASDINPIWLVRVMRSKVIDKTFKYTGIYDLYNVYSERVAPEYMPDKPS